METISSLLIGVGLTTVVLGLILWLFADQVGWLSHLPGDIKIERPGFSLYIPITTMALLSLSLSFILGLIIRFGR